MNLVIKFGVAFVLTLALLAMFAVSAPPSNGQAADGKRSESSQQQPRHPHDILVENLFEQNQLIEKAQKELFEASRALRAKSS